ncbi:hypothetical protein WA026_005876 [Henosepilachna vigintioctopunctata]|uniref:HAT C-terminal dimerisation domain-containing protein n=1 Tax=Henosepilachna vigintioctopunctata TaxID=420089 RepID=A0AAW1TU32_9CUCU
MSSNCVNGMSMIPDHHQGRLIWRESFAESSGSSNSLHLQFFIWNMQREPVLHNYAKEIKKRFIFSDPIFDIVSIVDPKVAQEFRVKSLTHILSRFPFLKTHVYSQELDNEWRQHALLDYTTHNIDVNSPADVYWGKVFSLKNNMNIQTFSNLKIVIGISIVLPFANASVERVFSSLNLIKSDQRNKLETTTLRSILHTKDGVLSNGGILKF